MLVSDSLKTWRNKFTQYTPLLPIKNTEVGNGIESTFLMPEVLDSQQKNSLLTWACLYLKHHVSGSSIKTQQAKRHDLDQFIQFYLSVTGRDDLDAWTPAMTRHFQESLLKTISGVTGKSYSPTTTNRVIATLRHFGSWLQQQRPFLAGNPFKGIKGSTLNGPACNVLTETQISALKMACKERIKFCRKGNQNPYLEAAVFYVLLQTGLRESELVSLNISQYHSQGLHQVVWHKNKRVRSKVPLPVEARKCLECYLKGRSKISEKEPLFLSRYGNRLASQDVRRICLRLLKQATRYEGDEKFKFTPYMLRYTF